MVWQMSESMLLLRSLGDFLAEKHSSPEEFGLCQVHGWRVGRVVPQPQPLRWETHPRGTNPEEVGNPEAFHLQVTKVPSLVLLKGK